MIIFDKEPILLEDLLELIVDESIHSVNFMIGLAFLGILVVF